jgi:methylthioribose-1-phosphate isomerase
MLIHGYSRVVTTVLLHAAKEKKYFTVYVTEGRPDCAGYQAAEELIKAGIPVNLVLDSAVGYIMEKVDFVLMGAEGVVENGGIINKVCHPPEAVAFCMLCLVAESCALFVADRHVSDRDDCTRTQTPVLCGG